MWSRLRVLGPDHLDTLVTRHHLAYWSGHAGDPTAAADALADLLADTVRVLGPDHPTTLTTRHDLAYWHGKTGNPVGGPQLSGLSIRKVQPGETRASCPPELLVSIAVPQIEVSCPAHPIGVWT